MRLNNLLSMIMITCVFMVLSGCSQLLFWQTKVPDNAVEEYVEDVIHDITGVDIDLTPITGEETQKLSK